MVRDGTGIFGGTGGSVTGRVNGTGRAVVPVAEGYGEDGVTGAVPPCGGGDQISMVSFPVATAYVTPLLTMRIVPSRSVRRTRAPAAFSPERVPGAGDRTRCLPRARLPLLPGQSAAGMVPSLHRSCRGG